MGSIEAVVLLAFSGIFTVGFVSAPFLPLLSAVQNFSSIPRSNARGVVEEELRFYAKSEAEAAEHLMIQKEVQKSLHSGEAFYSNTFRGWKKAYYDKVYKRTLRQDRLKAQSSKQRRLDEARKVDADHKQVQRLQLRSQLRQNKRNVTMGKSKPLNGIVLLREVEQ